MDLVSLWKAVLGRLEVDLGKDNFRLYFRNSQPTSLENGVAKIGFNNAAVAKQADQRYYAAIQGAIGEVTKLEKLSLVFEVMERPASAQGSGEARQDLGPLFETPKEDKEATAEAIRKAGLRADFILEEFCVSTSNQLAFAAAQAIVREPGKNYNPFFIWGGVGIGKTHLMQAIGHEMLRKNPHARVVFAPGEQFTNEIILGIRTKNTQDFKERYWSADALLIDDIQFLSGKDTAQEEFFHTFNAIQQRGGQIVMTSDRKPADIKDLADRLRSRFEGGMVADIPTPDSELKTAVCLLKAKKRGIELSTTIGSLIAGNVDNIRSLDGTLQLIITKALAEKREITEAFVAETLKIQLDNASKAGHLEARVVLNQICEFYGLTIKDIKGDKRDRPIARPRQVLMYLLKNYAGMTLDEVADFLGGRDHTTVMHGVKNIGILRENNQRVQSDLAELQGRLGV